MWINFRHTCFKENWNNQGGPTGSAHRGFQRGVTQWHPTQNWADFEGFWGLGGSKMVRFGCLGPQKKANFSNPGGLDLSRRGLDRDSWSRRQKSISLDGRENLDSFKKLVSTIEKSQSRSRFLDFVSMRLAKPILFSQDRDFSRLVETFVIFLDFSIFFSIEK